MAFHHASAHYFLDLTGIPSKYLCLIFGLDEYSSKGYQETNRSFGATRSQWVSTVYMLQDVTKSTGTGTSFTQGSDASSSLVLSPINTSGI